MSDLPVPVEHTVHARPRAGIDDRIDDPTAEPAAGYVPDYVRRLAWFLDDAIPIVGNRRIGADGFLSFIPIVGEAAGFGLASVIVLSGVRAGCSWVTIARMMFHAVGESALGMIPLVGPVIAFFWKANQRNLRIIEKNLQDREATRRESWKVLLAAIALILLTLAVALVGAVIAIYTIWRWISG